MNDGRGGFFAANRAAERESLLPPPRSSGNTVNTLHTATTYDVDPSTGPSTHLESPKLTLAAKPTLILTALALLFGLLLGSTINEALSTNILNPTVRDQIRAKWESEITQHTGLRQHMAEERVRWDSERKTREEERLEERKERTARDQIRAKWELELTQHSDLLQCMAEERTRWDSERETWQEERLEHSGLRQRMADERARWDAERKEWEDVRLRERKEALEERRRAREKMDEEEQKKKAGIHWLKLERAPHCTRYGTREYRAKLGPVGGGYDLLKACRETGVEIHGRVVNPSYCEDMGAYNGMWGVWMVDFDEAVCHTFWGDFKDKGCTAPGSGLRHIEANLKNHDAADEWTAMCSSTPYDFNGLHFDGAMSCANWGKYGIFGFWDIEDKNCE